jgi:outer membrane protein assembly factor BamA
MKNRCLIPVLIACVFFLSTQTSIGCESDSVRCAKGAEIYECARATRQALADSGYHAARVEIIQVGIEEMLLVERGPRFRSSQLRLNGIADSLIAVLQPGRSNQEYLTRSHIDELLTQIVERHAETGYPFAQLTVVEENVSADTLNLECRLLAGPHTRIGKIHYQGLEITRPTTLMRRHALRAGDWYRESDLSVAAAALARVDFCRLSSGPSLRFDSRADLVDIIFVMIWLISSL